MTAYQTPIQDPKKWVPWLTLALVVTVACFLGVFALYTTQAQAAVSLTMPTPAIVHVENQWMNIGGVNALCVRCDIISPLAQTPVPTLQPASK